MSTTTPTMFIAFVSGQYTNTNTTVFKKTEVPKDLLEEIGIEYKMKFDALKINKPTLVRNLFTGQEQTVPGELASLLCSLIGYSQWLEHEQPEDDDLWTLTDSIKCMIIQTANKLNLPNFYRDFAD